MMRRFTTPLAVASLLLVTGAAYAQNAPRPSFEVASIKPAAPLDMQKLAQQMMSGGEMPKLGPHVDGAQAEYTYMALRDLMVIAYKVKQYQITGPDWINNTRFDIKAKMPSGSTKNDAPLMLQSLLEDRFKLSVRREIKEHPVLALVVGKGGPKMKESEAAKPIDENAPLGPGESKMEGPDGPIRMKIDAKAGGAVVDMGAKGKYTYSVDRTTMTMHLQASQVTMSGLAEMITQFAQMGGAGSKTVIDETGLKGSYDVGFDFSLADLLNMARAAGMDIPAGAPGSSGGAASAAGGGEATTPGGGTSITDAVQALGLKLEQKKAPVEQLIVDHVEKTPTDN